MAFLGPILGGAASGIFGGLLSKLFGQNDSSSRGGSAFTRPEQVKEFAKFSPEQQQLQKYLGSALTGQGEMPTGGILGQLFSPEGFESYAAPARRQFFESTVPGLAERFSGLGAGAQKSSAFQQQLAKAGENLSTRLGEFRGQQQQSLLGPLLNQLMQPQFDRFYTPEQPSGLQKGLGAFGGEALKSGLPFLFDLLRSKFGVQGQSQQGGFGR